MKIQWCEVHHCGNVPPKGFYQPPEVCLFQSEFGSDGEEPCRMVPMRLIPDNAEADPNPNPSVWPKCSECAMAYVLRRMTSFTDGYRWVWQRDCKHRTAKAVIDAPNSDGETP